MLIRATILGSALVAAIAAATLIVLRQGEPASAPQSARGSAADVLAAIEDGRGERAEALARQLLSSAALEGRERTPAAAELLRLLARAMWMNGKQADPETFRCAELAVTIAVEASGEPSLEAAECRYGLAILCILLEDHPRARGELERALAQREALLGPDHPDVAVVLTFLAFLAYEEGRSAKEAKPLFARARAIQEASPSADPMDVAFRWSREAIVHSAAGDWEASREGHERALAIYEEHLRPNHPRIATQHHNLGTLCIDICDWPGASRHLEEALAMRRSELGEDHMNVAWTMGVLAKVRWYLGEREEARELWQSSLDVYAKWLGPESPQLLLPLQGIARAHLDSGELSAAEEQVERARAILARDDSANPIDVVWFEGISADIASRRGDRTAALEHLRRGLAVLEGVPDIDAQRADLLEATGGLLARGGDPAEVEQGVALLEQALELVREEYPADSPRPTWTQEELATALLRADRLDEAFAHALGAEASAREHLRATAARFEERSALSYAAYTIPGLPLCLRIAAAEPDPERAMQAWDALIRSRSIVFGEMLERRRLATLSRDPEVGALARALSEAHGHYADLAVRGQADPSSPAWQAQLADARKARERAERALLEASATERSARGFEDAGFAEIVRALPAGVALVSFARIARTIHGTPEYVALLWPPGANAPAVCSLGDAEAIDDLATRALALCRSVVGQAEYRRVAAGLRERVWDPIAPSLAGAREICIVPDGALVLLDFAALPTGEDAYLIESTPPIHYLSTERDLLPEDAPSGRGLLACGGPEYGRGDEADEPALLAAAWTRSAWAKALADLEFPLLPSAASEAREIAALWNRRGSEPEAVVLTGAAATEAAFERDARGREVLHLATHGFFLPSSAPSEDPRQRGVGVVTVARTPAAFALDLAPEHSLLSGLAFAGANARSHAASPDGILLAEEISALDLSGVRLAVLSACDTGLGQVQNGEGVFGLRRAFRLAGVRTLVTSLWPVVDDTAETRMIDFYRRWLEGDESVAQALRSAALRLLLDRRARGESTHPFHWAGVVAVGGRG